MMSLKKSSESSATPMVGTPIVESATHLLEKGTHYEAYLEGWNAAKMQEEEQGVIPFLLDELKKRMEAGEEWYGDSFDEPVQIVEKIQAAYQTERQREE